MSWFQSGEDHFYGVVFKTEDEFYLFILFCLSKLLLKAKSYRLGGSGVSIFFGTFFLTLNGKRKKKKEKPILCNNSFAIIFLGIQ